MSSKTSLFLLKSVILIQLLLSISAIYYSYSDLAGTYHQGNHVIWITFGVLLYWIIVGPIFVWGLMDSEHRQRALKLIGGVTLFLMLGLLMLSFSWIVNEKQIGDIIIYSMKLMLFGLLFTFFVGMQVSGGWDKLISRRKR
jgi:hypothetical protein